MCFWPENTMELPSWGYRRCPNQASAPCAWPTVRRAFCRTFVRTAKAKSVIYGWLMGCSMGYFSHFHQTNRETQNGKHLVSHRWYFGYFGELWKRMAELLRLVKYDKFWHRWLWWLGVGLKPGGRCLGISMKEILLCFKAPCWNGGFTMGKSWEYMGIPGLVNIQTANWNMAQSKWWFSIVMWTFTRPGTEFLAMTFLLESSLFGPFLLETTYHLVI